MIDLYTEHAKEKVGAPPEWEAYQYECLPPGAEKTQVIRITGAVAPMMKRKPRRDWAKMDKATKREAYFTPEEHHRWVLAWEQRTGNCSTCTGEGKVFQSISVTAGTTYKPCLRCAGSGKKPEPAWPGLDLGQS